jgi:antitoxin MazE
MIISKWGNSLAIRLPAELLKELDFKEGDDLVLSKLDEKALKLQKKPTRQELIEGLRKYQGRMPADFKFDREEANER